MEKFKKIAVSNFDALNRAAKIVGTKKTLATRIGVSKQVLNLWLNHDTPVPYEKVLAIYTATKGEVNADEFRSDCEGILGGAVEVYVGAKIEKIIAKLPSNFQGVMKELKIMLLKELSQ